MKHSVKSIWKSYGVFLSCLFSSIGIAPQLATNLRFSLYKPQVKKVIKAKVLKKSLFVSRAWRFLGDHDLDWNKYASKQISANISFNHRVQTGKKLKPQLRKCPAGVFLFTQAHFITDDDYWKCQWFWNNLPIVESRPEVQNISLCGHAPCSCPSLPANHKQPAGSRFLLCGYIEISTPAPWDGSSTAALLPCHCQTQKIALLKQ